MFRRAATLVLVNVVIFCVLAEVAGLIVHYARTGDLFYAARPLFATIPDTAQGELTADRLHPYFGPSHKVGHPFEIPAELRPAGAAPMPLQTNNFGFNSPYDFPIAKADREFIVGIFGGSVGVFFCAAGVDRLVDDLRRHEFFSRRTIVPLCMAHEGYKQPQQLLVLAYFLSIGQTFDLVINIDGFNEVALSTLNQQQGLDISMPSVSHLGPLTNLIDQATMTPEKLQSLASIDRYRQQLNELAGTLQRNRLASVGLLLGAYHGVVQRRYADEVRRFASLPSASSGSSLISTIPPIQQRAGRELYADIAANWARASQVMRDMLAAHGVSYVHVLQPNQYRTSRHFSPDEARVALNNDSPFKPGVEEGYPALLAEAASRRLTNDRGYVDATGIFDAETSPVYVDDCCHYTLTGYRLLADAIADAIMRIEAPWTAPRQP